MWLSHFHTIEQLCNAAVMPRIRSKKHVNKGAINSYTGYDYQKRYIVRCRYTGCLILDFDSSVAEIQLWQCKRL